MVRRRKPVETKVNHDRWLVSYADFITLLFAFFVVMYSVSQVNEAAYQELVETLGGAFDKGTAVSNVAASSDSQLANTYDLAETIKATLAELVGADQVGVSATDDWLKVRVNAELLFSSGSADPTEQAKSIFAQLAPTLASFENAIEVSGHTDNVPINNQKFSNNWELSAARATSVVALLSRSGVAPHRLSATGYGEFRPVADNSKEEGRAQNRRVVLMIARRQAARPKLPVADLPQALGTPSEGADRSGAAPADQQADVVSEPQAKEASQPIITPVIRDDGSLLFTNDPDRSVSE